MVGGATAVVQLGMLVALKLPWCRLSRRLRPGVSLSRASSILVLNIMLVWQDRPVAGNPLRALAKRWTAYHGCIALAVALNFGIFAPLRQPVAALPTWRRVLSK